MRRKYLPAVIVPVIVIIVVIPVAYSGILNTLFEPQINVSSGHSSATYSESFSQVDEQNATKLLLHSSAIINEKGYQPSYFNAKVQFFVYNITSDGMQTYSMIMAPLFAINLTPNLHPQSIVVSLRVALSNTRDNNDIFY